MHMAREIDEIPMAAARLATPEMRARLGAVADRLRAAEPAALLTVARGSSDHAATYLKYAAELTLGLPVASIGPSLASIYEARLRTEGMAVLAISQSGTSRDLTALTEVLSAAGGVTVTLTNTPTSGLASVADEVVDVMAGPERAVAATKSYVNSILAGLWLIGLWARDARLCRALDHLPDAFTAPRDAMPLFAGLETVDRAMVIARGAALGVAAEIALKLLETCGIHASAYSGAEVLHGPSAILSGGFPVIALTSGAGKGMDQAVQQLSRQGADLRVMTAAEGTGHPLVDPLLDLPALYRALERLSRARQMSPDAPPFLRKETSTL